MPLANGAVNLNAAAMANANLSAMVNMMAAVQAGFGLNLAGSGGLNALNGLLGPVNTNMASMPPFGNAPSAALMKKILDMLNALDAINKGLGVNLLEPGAGARLNAALAGMGQKSAGLGLGLSAGLGAGAQAGLGRRRT